VSPGSDPEGVEQLRRFWSRFFVRMSQLCYTRAAQIVTLSEINRKKQLADGAPADKVRIIPNGVDLDAITPATERKGRKRFKVGFVGRIVPIKDVLTLIKAVHLARHSIELEVELIGPASEDIDYNQRC